MANLNLTHKFDPSAKRHYLNNQLTVLHCHHYSTLFTQLAIDAKELVDGTKILQDVSEDVFFEVLSNYFKENSISSTSERVEIACQLFSAMGAGKMVANSADENGGDIELPMAHVDQGWLQKWGQHKEPVNYIGAGYIAGMFSAVFNKPKGAYKVEENQSQAMGAGKSVFKVSG